MKKGLSKINKVAVILGVLSTQLIMPMAYAQDGVGSDDTKKSIFEQFLSRTGEKEDLQDINQDVGQFLSVDNIDDDQQYILLTELKIQDRTIISLEEEEPSSGPELKINHQYQYNPSLSFNLPSSSVFGIGIPSNLNVAGLGGSQLILSITPSDDNNPKFARKSLNLVLGSSYLKAPINNYSTFLNEGVLAQQAYNLSLGIGYSGFHLGASYSRNDYLLSDDLSGFDLGFGYMGESWSADVRVGEYRRSREALFSADYNIFDNVSAYELGAAYKIFSNVNFTGRFTYYSYGQGGDIVALDDMQTLIFGTNLSF